MRGAETRGGGSVFEAGLEEDESGRGGDMARWVKWNRTLANYHTPDAGRGKATCPAGGIRRHWTQGAG